MLVFLTTVSGANLPGFYYWDHPSAAWVSIKGNNGGTLDQAYDFGGAGLGKTITADAGAVTIVGTDGLVSTGTFNSGAVTPSGTGTKMIWNPRKSAFRAGTTSATGWDDLNVGAYSVAFSAYNIASGNSAAAFGSSTIASGSSAAAFGTGTIASGSNAVAFGSSNDATGNNSTALGSANQASGTNAVAFGNGTFASGNHATAFGQDTYATASRATAFGITNTASGNNSTSFGQENVASGVSATAYGSNNSATSYGESVLGIGSTTYTPSANGATQFRTANATDRLFTIGNAIDTNNNNTVDATERRDAMIVLKNGLTRLPSTTNAMIGAADGKAVVTKEYLLSTTFGTLDQAYDFGGPGNGKTITADAGAVLINGTDGFVSTGTAGSGAVAPSGPGVKMFWNPRKGAFRAGRPLGNQWNDVSIGDYSTAFGISTTASGYTAMAFGDTNVASAIAATAFGRETNSTGIGSSSFGFNTTASAANATSFGNTTTASGIGATAFGSGTTASGERSLTFGLNAIASALDATAFGSSTTASGMQSLAFGSNTFAAGLRSTAFGTGTVASAADATAFGSTNTASGNSSTAYGSNNIAPSYAETVLGIGATTYTPSTNGISQFRAANATDRLFVIGNAIDTNNNNSVEPAERRDAMVVLKNGNTGIGTSAPTQRLHVAGTFRLVDGTQGAGRVLTSDANGNAIWNTLSATNAWGLGGNVGTNPGTNYIGTSDNNHFSIRTNGAERARFLNTGELGIGTTTPDRKFELSGNGIQYARLTNTTNGIVGLELKRGGGGSDWEMRNEGGEIIFGQSNDDLATVVDVVRIGGSSFTPVTDNFVQLGQSARRWSLIYATNGVVQTSDANDKKQMIGLTDGLDKINRLRPISFQWKDDSIDQSSTHLGFVAQEVQKVLPEVVVDGDWIDLPEGQGRVWQKASRLGVKYSEIVPVLVKAVQEQQTRIESQKTENDHLKKQLETQAQTLSSLLSRIEKLESKN